MWYFIATTKSKAQTLKGGGASPPWLLDRYDNVKTKIIAGEDSIGAVKVSKIEQGVN